MSRQPVPVVFVQIGRMKIDREHLLNAETWRRVELEELLFDRAEKLRLKGYERSCDYGRLARDEIHESVAALAAVRLALGGTTPLRRSMLDP